jgi:hypothetical protein
VSVPIYTNQFRTITALLGSWDDAYNLANAAVAQMTLDEKIGIVKGTGQLNPDRASSPQLLILSPFLTSYFA